MKLKVWDKDSINTTDKDQLFLRLISNEKSIMLCVVDKEGKEVNNGTLIVYDTNLKFFITCDEINDSVAVKTGPFGELIIMDHREYMDEIRERGINQLAKTMMKRMNEENEEKVSHH